MLHCRGASDSALANCRKKIGLDQPALTRFVTWSEHIVRGDLGVSVQRNKPITEIVGWRVRNTLVLAGMAALMGIPLAVFLGVVSGLSRDGPADVTISTLAIFGMTVPEFISGTLMILIFSVTLGWFSGVVIIGYKAPVLDLMRASILPAVVAGLVPMVLLRWRMNLLTLDDEEARSLGVETARLRLVLIAAATLMTAAAVSISGIIGWIGLLVPHVARALAGPDFARLLPAALLLGGGYLVAVDVLARTIAPIEVPLGILTAAIGAPFFLWLLLTARQGWR